jgi:AmiR/NasT family two-component response regulator
VVSDDPAEALAEALGDLASATVHAEHLERAVVSNRRIGMAMGILMERHRLTEDQAFGRLRELSQRRNVKLRDLAEEIIYTGDVAPRHD